MGDYEDALSEQQALEAAYHRHMEREMELQYFRDLEDDMNRDLSQEHLIETNLRFWPCLWANLTGGVDALDEAAPVGYQVGCCCPKCRRHTELQSKRRNPAPSAKEDK